MILQLTNRTCLRKALPEGNCIELKVSLQYGMGMVIDEYEVGKINRHETCLEFIAVLCQLVVNILDCESLVLRRLDDGKHPRHVFAKHLFEQRIVF